VAELDELALLDGSSDGLLIQQVRVLVFLHRYRRLLFLRWRRRPRTPCRRGGPIDASGRACRQSDPTTQSPWRR
jgi:hypothetical protein